jgi:hypothetical protein
MVSISQIFLWLTVVAVSFPHCAAQQRDQRVQLWMERTVNSTAQLMADTSLKPNDKEYSLLMATLALGRIGCVNETLELVDRSGFEAGSVDRQQFLVGLAEGLSTGDFVDDALKIAGSIENEFMRGSGFMLIAIRQSQRGDFGDAEVLLDQIPTQIYRDRAMDQICIEYLKIGKIDDARRLSSSVKDEDILSKIQKRIESQISRPSITDTDYVDFRINAIRHLPSSSVSEPEIDFFRHYYQAEVASELKNQSRLNDELQAAQQLAEGIKKNDGLLLLLGRLMHKAGKKDEAKSMYFGLFRKYAKERVVNLFPLDFNKMQFGTGKNSDAKIVADCMADDEARKTIEDLLKVDCAILVAAPLFGAVVKRSNPSWAEETFKTTTDAKIKVALAVNCLLELAD